MCGTERKADHEVVLEAGVKQNGDSFDCATPERKADREVALETGVKHNGDSFGCAALERKADREVAFEAGVKQSGDSLDCAALERNANREVDRSYWVPQFAKEKKFQSSHPKVNVFPTAQLQKGYNVPCFSCGVTFGATLQLISTPKYKWRCADCDAEECEGMADEYAADFDGEQDVGDDMWDNLATWKP